MFFLFKNVVHNLGFVRIHSTSYLVSTVHGYHIQDSDLLFKILVCGVHKENWLQKLKPFFDLVDFLGPLDNFYSFDRVISQVFGRLSLIVHTLIFDDGT